MAKENTISYHTGVNSTEDTALQSNNTGGTGVVAIVTCFCHSSKQLAGDCTLEVACLEVAMLMLLGLLYLSGPALRFHLQNFLLWKNKWHVAVLWLQ